ncbi:MAG TPA: hypothetical protein VHU77_10445 [Candidatus Limnocylindria bacterium]|nr:hypothetical protein [Candidatus Limnocylindria bacterium]
MMGQLQVCDAPTCGELATHELLVQLPDVEREVFHLCRSHERAAVSIIVRRRPAAPKIPATSAGGRKLRRPGILRWLVKGSEMNVASEDLDATAKRELTTDTEQNIYREVLQLDDGTRLEITASLTDHNEQG